MFDEGSVAKFYPVQSNFRFERRRRWYCFFNLKKYINQYIFISSHFVWDVLLSLLCRRRLVCWFSVLFFLSYLFFIIFICNSYASNCFVNGLDITRAAVGEDGTVLTFSVAAAVACIPGITATRRLSPVLGQEPSAGVGNAFVSLEDRIRLSNEHESGIVSNVVGIHSIMPDWMRKFRESSGNSKKYQRSTAGKKRYETEAATKSSSSAFSSDASSSPSLTSDAAAAEDADDAADAAVNDDSALLLTTTDAVAAALAAVGARGWEGVLAAVRAAAAAAAASSWSPCSAFCGGGWQSFDEKAAFAAVMNALHQVLSVDVKDPLLQQQVRDVLRDAVMSPEQKQQQQLQVKNGAAGEATTHGVGDTVIRKCNEFSCWDSVTRKVTATAARFVDTPAAYYPAFANSMLDGDCGVYLQLAVTEVCKPKLLLLELTAETWKQKIGDGAAAAALINRNKAEKAGQLETGTIDRLHQQEHEPQQQHEFSFSACMHLCELRNDCVAVIYQYRSGTVAEHWLPLLRRAAAAANDTSTLEKLSRAQQQLQQQRGSEDNNSTIEGHREKAAAAETTLASELSGSENGEENSVCQLINGMSPVTCFEEYAPVTRESSPVYTTRTTMTGETAATVAAKAADLAETEAAKKAHVVGAGRGAKRSFIALKGAWPPLCAPALERQLRMEKKREKELSKETESAKATSDVSSQLRARIQAEAAEGIREGLMSLSIVLEPWKKLPGTAYNSNMSVTGAEVVLSREEAELERMRNVEQVHSAAAAWQSVAGAGGTAASGEEHAVAAWRGTFMQAYSSACPVFQWATLLGPGCTTPLLVHSERVYKKISEKDREAGSESKEKASQVDTKVQRALAKQHDELFASSTPTTDNFALNLAADSGAVAALEHAVNEGEKTGFLQEAVFQHSSRKEGASTGEMGKTAPAEADNVLAAGEGQQQRQRRKIAARDRTRRSDDESASTVQNEDVLRAQRQSNSHDSISIERSSTDNSGDKRRETRKRGTISDWISKRYNKLTSTRRSKDYTLRGGYRGGRNSGSNTKTAYTVGDLNADSDAAAAAAVEKQLYESDRAVDGIEKVGWRKCYSLLIERLVKQARLADSAGNQADKVVSVAARTAAVSRASNNLDDRSELAYGAEVSSSSQEGLVEDNALKEEVNVAEANSSTSAIIGEGSSSIQTAAAEKFGQLRLQVLKERYLHGDKNLTIFAQFDLTTQTCSIYALDSTPPEASSYKARKSLSSLFPSACVAYNPGILLLLSRPLDAAETAVLVAPAEGEIAQQQQQVLKRLPPYTCPSSSCVLSDWSPWSGCAVKEQDIFDTSKSSTVGDSSSTSSSSESISSKLSSSNMKNNRNGGTDAQNGDGTRSAEWEIRVKGTVLPPFPGDICPNHVELRLCAGGATAAAVRSGLLARAAVAGQAKELQELGEEVAKSGSPLDPEEQEQLQQLKNELTQSEEDSLQSLQTRLQSFLTEIVRRVPVNCVATPFGPWSACSCVEQDGLVTAVEDSRSSNKPGSSLAFTGEETPILDTLNLGKLVEEVARIRDLESGRKIDSANREVKGERSRRRKILQNALPGVGLPCVGIHLTEKESCTNITVCRHTASEAAVPAQVSLLSWQHQQQPYNAYGIQRTDVDLWGPDETRQRSQGGRDTWTDAGDMWRYGAQLHQLRKNSSILEKNETSNVSSRPLLLDAISVESGENDTAIGSRRGALHSSGFSNVLSNDINSREQQLLAAGQSKKKGKVGFASTSRAEVEREPQKQSLIKKSYFDKGLAQVQLSNKQTISEHNKLRTGLFSPYESPFGDVHVEAETRELLRGPGAALTHREENTHKNDDGQGTGRHGGAAVDDQNRRNGSTAAGDTAGTGIAADENENADGSGTTTPSETTPLFNLILTLICGALCALTIVFVALSSSTRLRHWLGYKDANALFDSRKRPARGGQQQLTQPKVNKSVRSMREPLLGKDCDGASITGNKPKLYTPLINPEGSPVYDARGNPLLVSAVRVATTAIPAGGDPVYQTVDGLYVDGWGQLLPRALLSPNLSGKIEQQACVAAASAPRPPTATVVPRSGAMGGAWSRSNAVAEPRSTPMPQPVSSPYIAVPQAAGASHIFNHSPAMLIPSSKQGQQRQRSQQQRQER